MYERGTGPDDWATEARFMGKVRKMTKAEAQAHMDTLQEARTAAERAVRRVMQEAGETGLLGPLNAINTAFENAIERIRMTRTED